MYKVKKFEKKYTAPVEVWWDDDPHEFMDRIVFSGFYGEPLYGETKDPRTRTSDFYDYEEGKLTHSGPAELWEEAI